MWCLVLTAAVLAAMVRTCSTPCIDRERPERSPSPESPVSVETLPLRHITIGRRDLPPGVQSAQCTHAAGESGAMYGAMYGRMPPGTYAVALWAPSEGALRDISKKLAARGFEHVLVEECDEPYAGQAMAIGIVPTRDREGVAKVISSLPTAFKGVK